MAPHCAHLRDGVKMGDFSDGRHHDQGRPVGRLQRLPHGQHRRERRARVPDHPRGRRTSSPSPRRTRPRRRRRPASSRTRSSRSRSRPARATSSSTRTSTSAPARRIEPIAKLRPAFAKDGTVTAGNASGINDGAAARRADDRRGSRAARPHAARPHRLLGDRRRRSGDHGHRADPGVAQGAGEGRLEGRRPRPDRGQRGLRGAGLRGQQGHGLGPARSSTSMAAPSPSAIRSAPRARASWSRCCTRCSGATPRRASPRSASAAAWASPCASSAEDARSVH